jgi:hypothetical protein
VDLNLIAFNGENRTTQTLFGVDKIRFSSAPTSTTPVPLPASA